jgi:hypothetical protein
MNVRELIAELEKIDNQELPVHFFYFENGGYTNVYDNIRSVEIGTDQYGNPSIELKAW